MPTSRCANVGTSDDARPTHADTDMPVRSVANVTKRQAVEELRLARERSSLGIAHWKRPKWSRGFLWVQNATPYSPSASLTEIACALPDVPDEELHNAVATSTLASHPQLFKIVTPILMDCFEQLLDWHPNWALVTSI